MLLPLIRLASCVLASALVVSMLASVGCMPDGINFSLIKTFSDRLAKECFQQLVTTGGVNKEDLCKKTCEKDETSVKTVDATMFVTDSPQLVCIEEKIQAALKLTKEDVANLQKKDPNRILVNIKTYTKLYGITSTCEPKELCDTKLNAPMQEYIDMASIRVSLIKTKVGTATFQMEALNMMHIDYPHLEKRIRDRLDACFNWIQQEFGGGEINAKIAATMCTEKPIDGYKYAQPGPMLFMCLTSSAMKTIVAEAYLVKAAEEKEQPANDEKLKEYWQKARQTTVNKEKTAEYWEQFQQGPVQPRILRAFAKYYATVQACAKVMGGKPLGDCVVKWLNDRIDIMNGGLHSFYTGMKAKAQKIEHLDLPQEKAKKCPPLTLLEKEFLVTITRP